MFITAIVFFISYFPFYVECIYVIQFTWSTQKLIKLISVISGKQKTSAATWACNKAESHRARNNIQVWGPGS